MLGSVLKENFLSRVFLRCLYLAAVEMPETAIDTFTYAYTRSEARKSPLLRQAMPPLFDEPTTLRNWHKHINWGNSIVLFGTPLIALYGILTTELRTKTMIWSIIYYFITLLGITAGMLKLRFYLNYIIYTSVYTFLGYHRLWSHRAYRSADSLRWFFSFTGAGAVQGSIYWWSRGHRAHHRWTDTDKDPYSAHRGLLFSHIFWTIIKRPKSRIGYADASDLKSDPIVAFQHKYYFYFALGMGFLFPTLVAGFGWNDFRVCKISQNFLYSLKAKTFDCIREVTSTLPSLAYASFIMQLSVLTAWPIFWVKILLMIITLLGIIGLLLWSHWAKAITTFTMSFLKIIATL